MPLTWIEVGKQACLYALKCSQHLRFYVGRLAQQSKGLIPYQRGSLTIRLKEWRQQSTRNLIETQVFTACCRKQLQCFVDVVPLLQTVRKCQRIDQAQIRPLPQLWAGAMCGVADENKAVVVPALHDRIVVL